MVEEEFNLSDKVDWDDMFNKKDVKEFIKRLKKEVKDDTARVIIDKLAGEKLT